MKIFLDAKPYEITDDGVIETALPNYSEPYRLSTEQSRNALLGVSNWVQKFHGGFGRYLCPEDDPYNAEGKFWDSNCETRFAKDGYVYPPFLKYAATSNDLAYTHEFENYKGELYALGFAGAVTSGQTIIGQWTGSTTTWAQTAGLGDSAVNYGSVPTPAYLKRLGNTLVTHLYNVASSASNIRLYTSTDGTTWAAATQTGRVVYASPDEPGPILNIGTTWIITYWDNSAGAILVYKSTDSGANVTLIDTVPSAGNCLGLASWRDVDGNSRIWMRTRENFGYIDHTAASAAYIPLVSTPGQLATDFGIEEWNGSLYVPDQEGLVRCSYISGVLVVDAIGLNLGSGVIAAKQGRVTAITRSNRWLFIAYGGLASGKTSNVFAWDGKGWHFIATGASNQRILALAISSNDDDVVRLHFSLRVTSTSTLHYLNYLLDNPEANSSTLFEDTKTITTIIFDAGMAEISGAVLRDDVNAKDLTASTAGEYIIAKYGIDGAAASASSLGNFLSGTTQLAFASSAGTEFKTIQFEYTLERAGTATNCPKMQYPVLKFKKKPASRYARYFTVDIKKTAGNQIGWSKETVITNLKNAKDSQTLLAFLFEQQTSDNVEITDLKFGYQWVRGLDKPVAQARNGYVAVTVEEPL